LAGFFLVGGVGIIISAMISGDWPMYACIILSSAGVMVLEATVWILPRVRKS